MLLSYDIVEIQGAKSVGKGLIIHFLSSFKAYIDIVS